LELFSFDSITAFPYPTPELVTEHDSLWHLEASRREAALFAHRDDADPNWLLEAAKWHHYTGSYLDGARYAAKTISAAPPDEIHLHARAQGLLCMCRLAVGNGAEANQALAALYARSMETQDPFILAYEMLVRALYQEKNIALADSGPIGGDAQSSLWLFGEAANRFTALGEIDLAVRAWTEYARVQIEMGRYIDAIGTIEAASRLAKTHDRWHHIGRLLLNAGMAATDQGYRKGVEKTLRNGIAWCHYLGDAWGRTDGWTALGRLLGYEMPAGNPDLAHEPDRYLRKAVEEAERMGLTWMVAGIDNTRAWVFRKAGNESRSRHLLGEDADTPNAREKLALDSTQVTERINDTIRQKTANRLHDGVEHSPDPFFVFDAIRNIEGDCRDFVSPYANLAAIHMIGRDPVHVCLYSEARTLPHLGGLEDPLLRAVEGRESFEDLIAVPQEDGEAWFQRRIAPSGDGAVLTLRDVTAEKRIEVALRHSAESAARSEQAKSTFLANMSHEIRTPLNGVLGLARMLAETPLDETQRSYVEDIVASGDMLLDLIGDILDVSKIESQDMRLSPQAISLPVLVSGIVKLFRGQAEEKSTSLGYRLETNVPETVFADGVRLRQILANLVGNAVKFTREGKVEIRVWMDGDLTTFEVRDSGVGIPLERLETIFDRFQQAGSAVYGGTGLGLTICRALAELMGGDVRVTSELGKGSSFFVRLPLKAVRETVLAISTEPSLRFDGRRILLVDDNRVNMLVSTHALRKLGCDVVYAEDGQKALDALAREAFDLVLMDVRMPVLNGLDATRELRRREGDGPRLPVVALTAGALLHEQKECFEAGMDDFASKPFTTDSIREVLARWLGGPRTSFSAFL
jgi:signal transduction histidine kinase/ActR/RegA family two-component response regulator/tetratricopeptide (TPR) repeat protein